MSSVYIIAEAGVNHNGNPEMAFQLVDAAAKAGANAVKFQTFKSENLVTQTAGKAAYQKQTTDAAESQFEMLKRLELDHKTHLELINYCHKKGIDFLSTAFDSGSLVFLVDDIKLKTLKIPSGEITNGPFLLEHARTGCDLILSTGMATIEEVEEALGVIAFGFLNKENIKTRPTRKLFKQAYHSKGGKEILKNKVTVLHCTTEYPAPPEDINLRAIITMREKLGLRVGLSDHSAGIAVSIAAAAMGCVLIEKHFTLDRGLSGPDHKASLVPDELKEMIDSVRVVEKSMGDGLKQPSSTELKNRQVVRKSIVCSEKIKKGDLLTKVNIMIKRPGTGRTPMSYWDILGTSSDKDYNSDEVIF